MEQAQRTGKTVPGAVRGNVFGGVQRPAQGGQQPRLQLECAIGCAGLGHVGSNLTQIHREIGVRHGAAVDRRRRIFHRVAQRFQQARGILHRLDVGFIHPTVDR